MIYFRFGKITTSGPGRNPIITYAYYVITCIHIPYDTCITYISTPNSMMPLDGATEQILISRIWRVVN